MFLEASFNPYGSSLNAPVSVISLSMVWIGAFNTPPSRSIRRPADLARQQLEIAECAKIHLVLVALHQANRLPDRFGYITNRLGVANAIRLEGRPVASSRQTSTLTFAPNIPPRPRSRPLCSTSRILLASHLAETNLSTHATIADPDLPEV
jgi:hypothetical protein